MLGEIERKIMKHGASKVVGLPPDWLRIFKLDVGDSVQLVYGSIIIIKAKNLKIDPDFLRKEFDLMMRLESSQKCESQKEARHEEVGGEGQ